MPFNGSGTYNAPANSWNPAVTNTAISSTDWTSLLSDLTTALSTALCKDGQSTPTANLPMGGFKLTGLGAGSAAGNSIRYEQLFTSQSLTDGATINWDTSTAPMATVTLGGNRTMAAPTNMRSGGRYELLVTQDGTGGRTLTWNAVFKAQGGGVMPQPESTAAAVTLFRFVSDATNLYLDEQTPFMDTNYIVRGATDPSKKVRIEVDGLTTATTRVITMPDSDVTLNLAATTGNSGIVQLAAQADMETGTSTTLVPTVSVLKNLPLMPKAWAVFDGTTVGTNAPTAGSGITSITRNGTGDYTVNFSITFSAATYAMVGTCVASGGTTLRSVNRVNAGTYTTTAFQFGVYAVSDITSNALADASWVSVAFFGDL